MKKIEEMDRTGKLQTILFVVLGVIAAVFVSLVLSLFVFRKKTEGVPLNNCEKKGKVVTCYSNEE